MCDDQQEIISGWKLDSLVTTRQQIDVYLNVYDLLDDCVADFGIAQWNLGKTVRELNTTSLGSLEMGMFHAAVEICGVEYSFGFCAEGTGIYSATPKISPGYRYRCTIEMGSVSLRPSEAYSIIHSLANVWLGSTYNILERNCCHFAIALCNELGVEESVPPWINALATSLVPVARGAKAISEIPRNLAFIACVGCFAESDELLEEDDEFLPTQDATA